MSEAENKRDKNIIIHETHEQYILLNRKGFEIYLSNHPIKRSIKWVQNHHTWKPRYENFDGNNHIAKLKGMKRSHTKPKSEGGRGFSDIAQNLTTFPDGLIAICRPLEVVPAGIKGKNTGGICIEHIGNFDIDGDTMTEEHKKTIVWINAELLKHKNLPVNLDTVIYHTWYASKSCPGTNFFGGNTKADAETNFLPLIKAQL